MKKNLLTVFWGLVAIAALTVWAGSSAYFITRVVKHAWEQACR